jgi:hypothetical protein
MQRRYIGRGESVLCDVVAMEIRPFRGMGHRKNFHTPEPAAGPGRGRAIDRPRALRSGSCSRHDCCSADRSGCGRWFNRKDLLLSWSLLPILLPRRLLPLSLWRAVLSAPLLSFWPLALLLIGRSGRLVRRSISSIGSTGAVSRWSAASSGRISTSEQRCRQIPISNLAGPFQPVG